MTNERTMLFVIYSGRQEALREQARFLQVSMSEFVRACVDYGISHTDKVAHYVSGGIRDGYTS